MSVYVCGAPFGGSGESCIHIFIGLGIQHSMTCWHYFPIFSPFLEVIRTILEKEDYLYFDQIQYAATPQGMSELPVELVSSPIPSEQYYF